MAPSHSLYARLSEILVNKLDLAFTLGRIFGLLPVVIMSRMITDTTLLADRISDYQVAMFLATLVLYGAPQVYLVKHGVERRVFVFHMAISSIVVAVALILGQTMGLIGAIAMPFVFLVLFRSYYLLFASYLKSQPTPSYALVAVALMTLAAFAATLNYAVSTVTALVLIGAFAYWQGYTNLRFAWVALRKYFTILRWNAGYFVTFLLSQTYTQITLAVYAFFASGTDYLRATHLVYIYSLSFIFHGILFRYYLSKMSRERGAGQHRQNLRSSLRLSLMLGAATSFVVVVAYAPIEILLFSRSFLSLPTALTLAVMILITATNAGWSALFVAVRRPYTLAAISAISAAIVIFGIVISAALEIGNGLIWAMLIGLSVQALVRSLMGMRLLKEMNAKES